jgi:hypothetical protein
MRVPNKNATLSIFTVSVEQHTSSENTSLQQSHSRLLAQFFLGQIVILGRNGNHHVFNLTETAFRSNSQASINISRFSYAPTANEADWAPRTMAPQMLMSNNYFSRTINAVNKNPLM